MSCLPKTKPSYSPAARASHRLPSLSEEGSHWIHFYMSQGPADGQDHLCCDQVLRALANLSVLPSDSTRHQSPEVKHGFCLCWGEVLVSLMNYADKRDPHYHSEGSMVVSTVEKRGKKCLSLNYCMTKYVVVISIVLKPSWRPSVWN